MELNTFHLFPRLPVEIRQMIWNDVLEEESNHRFVLFNWRRRRASPRPHLASPLLMVNTESRARALATYTLRLDVWRKPAALLAANYPGFLRACGIDELELAGALYLNPRRDVFVKLDHPPNPLSSHRICPDARESGLDVALHRYTTGRMNRQSCTLVRRCLDTVVNYDPYMPCCRYCWTVHRSVCRHDLSLANPHVQRRRLNVFPELEDDILFSSTWEDITFNFEAYVKNMCQCQFFQAFEHHILPEDFQLAQLDEHADGWRDEIDPTYEDSDRESHS